MSKYKDSIITKDMTRCLVCRKSSNIEIHHAIFGTSGRKLSTEYGLVAPLCYEHHRGNNGVHNNKELADKVKAIAQEAFEKEYGHSKWMAVFGKNYLEEEKWKE